VNAPADTLTERATRAVQWRLAASAAGAFCRFGVGVLLARLLAPSDFGLVALASIVLGVLRPLGNLGLANALVQRRNLSDRDVRTAFTFSVLLGLVLAAAIAIAAPVGASIMREPRVVAVLRVLSLGFAFQGASIAAGGLLRRQLHFKQQFFIEVGSYLVGYAGVALTLAISGYGVWSLVIGGLCQTLLVTCGLLAVVRHSVRPLVATRELGELLHFGVGSSAAAFVNYLAVNGDSFVVGRWLGPSSLGLYNRSYALMNLPYSYVASVMSSVLFPALARVQEEPDRLRRAYLILTQLTAMIAAPAMGILAVGAPHLVRTLYGPQWNGVVVPLQILCAAGYFRALYHLGGIVAQSVGRVYTELRNQAVYAALVILGALAGFSRGLGGVAVGVAIAIVFMFIATGQLALSATATPWRTYWKAQTRALTIGTIATIAAFLARTLLEVRGASSAVISVTVVAVAAVPWGVGLLWTLSAPEFKPVLTRFPRWLLSFVEAGARFTAAR
jgi:O-antigen/teichoic acid export membrane protein